MVSLLWADVKYHVPTGIGFSPKASGFYPFGDATALVRGRRWCCGMSDFKPRLESATPHHTTNAALPNEGGGIAKRIKTTRLRRKTKPGSDVILHARP